MIKVEERRRRVEASFLDDLFKDLSKSMLHGVAERLEDSFRGVLRWSLKKLALTLIGIGITVTAVVLLLIAGVEGLMAVAFPKAVAYLIAGGVGLGVGLPLFLMKK